MENIISEIESPFTYIEKITFAGAPYRILFTDDSIFFLNKGGLDMAGDMALSHLFGLLGRFIAYLFLKNTQEIKAEKTDFSNKSLEEILKEDSKNAKVDYADIQKYETMGSNVRYRGNRPIFISAKDLKYGIYLPKDLYEQVLNLLGQKCAGKLV